MTEDQLVQDIFDKEGRKYGDQYTTPPIDQPTAAGGIILETLREYVAETGVALTVSIDTLKRLTPATADPIVRWKIRRTIRTLGIEDVWEPLRLQIVDFYYNSGTYAIKWLQRVLRVEPDGRMGSVTRQALAKQDPWLVHHALIAARLQMLDLWTDAVQKRKQWEEGLENRALTFSLLAETSPRRESNSNMDVGSDVPGGGAT